ncbi:MULTISPECIES: hypothetical protein [unclassified Pseudomonas]|uniref:hypothetical protein n=1 Tax=Pseudomonas TaxID=286 RepID=UPI001012E029|nr:MULTISPECIES: hypothetical protein [unclassified Pseudomonas]QAY89581.1 hypothetical protein CUN63_06380 [Pseudomonas sp. ACM7]TFB45045.1 hypothetical protein E3W21_01665 [Pseudomonas sp. F01002]
MNKLKQRISNPMTLIAIFATLSETSAAVSLPFLGEDEKEIYVWFLISFPFYLLFLFFATLNFNYRSLYAPSDFEKSKHFIKAMDNTEPSEKNDTRLTPESSAPSTSPMDRRSTHPPCNAQDPPETDLQTILPAEHYIRLPERLKDLYIVDARGMSQKIELGASLEKIQKEQGKPAHVIVFITCAESERLLKESALKHSKNAKKHSGVPFCVAYNLNSNGVTVIDQTYPLATSGV